MRFCVYLEIYLQSPRNEKFLNKKVLEVKKYIGNERTKNLGFREKL